jgi:hypothetical protein
MLAVLSLLLNYYIKLVNSKIMPNPKKYPPLKDAIEYEVINLTPHDVHIFYKDNLICTFPPSFIVARCNKTTEVVGYCKVGLNRFVQIAKTKYLEVEGLPEPKEGLLYIVSKLVAEKFKGIRNDLVITNGHIRLENGEVKGCSSLGIIE